MSALTGEQNRRRWAFVTGGSSGIGRAFAEAIAVRGYDVVIAARGAGRLVEAMARLQTVSSGSHEQIVLDVADEIAVSKAAADLVSERGAPELVLMSAGIAVPGAFEQQPLVDHDTHWQVNYRGALAVAHALAPTMVRARRGRLIFVSSAVALGGFHGYAAYAPSKWALRGLARTLSVELEPKGVGVTIAFPPDTDTAQLAVEQATRTEVARLFAGAVRPLAAHDVARAILRACDRGRREVAPGVGAELLRLFEPGWARILERRQRILAARLDRARD